MEVYAGVGRLGMVTRLGWVARYIMVMVEERLHIHVVGDTT